MTHRILLIAALCFSLHGALAAAEATSVEVFVERDEKSHRGPNLTVPAGTGTLHFLVNPKSFSARYKLEGLDEDWKQRTDTVLVRVLFSNTRGDTIQTNLFPASGRSPGWKGTVEDSIFTSRLEKLTVPPDANVVTIIMTTAGPAALVGVFAIKDMAVTSIPKATAAPAILFPNDRLPGGEQAMWRKSGSHPSMATQMHLGEQEDSSRTLVIVDEEAEAKIPSLCPDVVLMDINLPGKSGIDCIRGLKKRLPNLEVVMLTAYEEEDNIFRALKEGASG